MDMDEDKDEGGQSQDSGNNEKKRKRSGGASFQFVNITHPRQSKEKDVLKAVRQHAMNNHLFRNSAPDLAESERVSRLPRRLRSIINQSLDTPMPESRLPRAASVPKDVNPGRVRKNTSHQKLSRRVSSGDAWARPSPPPQGRSRSEDDPSLRQRASVVQESSGCRSPFERGTNFQEHIQTLRRYCDHFFATDDLDNIWRVHGIEDRTFYLSCLCVAARHMEASFGTTGGLDTLALDTEVVESINEKLKDPQVQTSDNTIASALHIAICYNYSVPGRVDWYNLIRTLVELRGGLEQLESFPFLSSAVLINGLASAIFQEAVPHQMFLNAASTSSKAAGNPSHGLESPICWSSTGLSQVESSVRCSKQLFTLLQAIRHAVDVVATGDSSPRSRRQLYQAQRMDVRSQLLTFRQISSRAGTESPSHVHVYESCRVAAIILERALFYAISLSEAMRGKELLQNLKDALLKTDLDSCWGDMAGVLLWVSYVGAAASNGVEAGDNETSRLRAWHVGCATRVTIKTAFTSPGDIIRALHTFSRIQEVCALPEN